MRIDADPVFWGLLGMFTLGWIVFFAWWCGL